MIPFLLVLLMTGPFRALAPLEEGDQSLVIQSINDIVGDRWLELAPSSPESCDGPCTVILASSPTYDCGDLRDRVARAKAGWAAVRQAALDLGQALEQPFEVQEEAYHRLSETMRATRAILAPTELRRDLTLERSWTLEPEILLPGLPGAWRPAGAAFRVERKTGKILEGREVEVQTSAQGSGLKVAAKFPVAPVEYCAGDVSFRIEGAAVFQFEMPLRTHVALVGDGRMQAGQSVTYPGDL